MKIEEIKDVIMEEPCAYDYMIM